MFLDFLLVLPPQTTQSPHLGEAFQTSLLEEAAEVIPVRDLKEEEEEKRGKKEEGLSAQLAVGAMFLLAFPSKCGLTTILAIRRLSLLMVDLHCLHEERLDLAYSVRNGLSSPSAAMLNEHVVTG